MRSIARDLTGQRFGRLVVLSKEVVRDRYKWKCKCDCGKTHFVVESNLLRAHTQSCGCLMREVNRDRGKHNGRHLEPEYVIWKNIKQKASGSRGRAPYEVEPTWLESYETFYNDVGPRPSLKHRLHREVLALGFVKGNCVWRESRR